MAETFNVYADSPSTTPQPPVLMTTPQPRSAPAPWFLTVNTNFDLFGTNEEEYKANVTGDAMEVGLLKKINDIKVSLTNSRLDSYSRGRFQHLLTEFRAKLADHREMIQKNRVFIASMRSNPTTGWTNMPDPIEQLLASDVRRDEQILANPSIDPNTRNMYEKLLWNSREKLADHETNAQLWINLRMAEQSGNTAKTAYAEKELANYLSVRLGKIQGKVYPPDMSLSAIMEQYQIQADGGKFDRRKVIVSVIVLLTLLPLFFWGCKMLWQRKAQKENVSNI
jgi:hypothetical protein